MDRAAPLALLLTSGCLLVENPGFTSSDGAASGDSTSPVTGVTTDPAGSATGAASTVASIDASTDASTDVTATPTSTADPTTGTSTTTEGGTTTDPVASDTSTGEPPVELPACDPNDTALIACYDFEPDPNDPTRLVDGSQFGNHGVVTNAAVVAGVAGQGVEILEVAELRVLDTGGLGVGAALSLTAWVQLAGPPAVGQRVGVLDKDSQWGVFIHDVDGLACTVGSVKLSAAQPFPTGTWTHIGCVFDGRRVRLYIDGQAVAEVVNAGPIAAGMSPLLLGCNSPDCAQRMIGGRLDAVRVWNTAIPDSVLCAEAGACS